MFVVDQRKKHFLFPLVLPCIGSIWEEILLMEEGGALAREPVTDLMALARSFCCFGLQFPYL